MLWRALILLGVALLACCAAAGDPPKGIAGLQRNVEFTEYLPLSSSTELLRRLFSPLNALRVVEESTSSGKPLREQRVDLANETFTVYVPPHAPPHGYALLVFVPPWATATVPKLWMAALDRHDMIFVSAANSGNGADVLNRRKPLALLAAENIMRSYPVDRERVYIGGFSGGSRMALRIALGYPDVFHGALLNASSDPIGNAQIPLPPRELLRQFQESTRVVYVTGAHDNFNLAADVVSRQSLQQWCVFDLVTEDVPWAAHELLDSAAFSRSLDALVKPASPDPHRIAACRARIDQTLASEFKQVQDLLTSGERVEARRQLRTIDAHYGGLAAPRSTELAVK
jgi:predicted esterase